MSDRCETRSGPYQCMHGKGHDGECEAQPDEYATSKRRVNIDPQPLPEPTK